MVGSVHYLRHHDAKIQKVHSRAVRRLYKVQLTLRSLNGRIAVANQFFHVVKVLLGCTNSLLGLLVVLGNDG